MHIKTIHLSAESAVAMQQQLRARCPDTPASLAICFGTVPSIQLLSTQPGLAEHAANWLASTSCLGCADDHGLHTASPYSATVLLIHDPQGAYGVAATNLTDNIAEQAADALQQAMRNAGKPDELPTLIWCTQAPGCEESIIAGMQSLVGDRVPIYGGSSADNSVNGEWLQFDGASLYQNALVVAVFYPDAPLSSYFSSGYANTALSGLVTSVENRKLITIDNKPAANVYNDWLGTLGEATLTPGNILMPSTQCPLGRLVVCQDHIPMNLLAHPAHLHEDGSLTLFSQVSAGDKIWLMHGNKTDLISRAGEVVRIAKQNLKFQYNLSPAGAIIVYCAGCMLAVQARLAEVQQAIQNELGDIPFLVTFTFGEQGCFADGSNRHGNLMISAVLFGANDVN